MEISVTDAKTQLTDLVRRAEQGDDVVVTRHGHVGAAHGRWGKGVHPAGRNFGDCFAYEVAKRHYCPLLRIGEGFALTGLRSALG